MWVRRTAASLAEERARANRPPSLLVSLGIGAAGAGIVFVVTALRLPLVFPRTGVVTRLPDGPAPPLFTALFAFLITFPTAHLLRRQDRGKVRGPAALICVGCHEPQDLGTPACPHCGGALEPLHLWEWREEVARPAYADVVDMVDVVGGAWGFTGLVPRAVLEVNAFGNLLVEDVEGKVWRIAPEDLSCTVVASSGEELVRLRASPAFQADWRMERLVALAVSTLGARRPGSSFCLKRPSVLGGGAGPDNLGMMALPELIASSGHIAQTIQDVPDGAQVAIKIVD